MRFLRIALALAILVIAVAGGFVLWSKRAESAAIEPPMRADFDRAVIEQGAQLAASGNCVVCHTVPGGPAYPAAGRSRPRSARSTAPISHLSPRPTSGAGRRTRSAAMREGVARGRHHLYPAFPYAEVASAERVYGVRIADLR